MEGGNSGGEGKTLTSTASVTFKDVHEEDEDSSAAAASAATPECAEHIMSLPKGELPPAQELLPFAVSDADVNFLVEKAEFGLKNQKYPISAELNTRLFEIARVFFTEIPRTQWEKQFLEKPSDYMRDTQEKLDEFREDEEHNRETVIHRLQCKGFNILVSKGIEAHCLNPVHAPNLCGHGFRCLSLLNIDTLIQCVEQFVPNPRLYRVPLFHAVQCLRYLSDDEDKAEEINELGGHRVLDDLCKFNIGDFVDRALEVELQFLTHNLDRKSKRAIKKARDREVKEMVKRLSTFTLDNITCPLHFLREGKSLMDLC